MDLKKLKKRFTGGMAKGFKRDPGNKDVRLTVQTKGYRTAGLKAINVLCLLSFKGAHRKYIKNPIVFLCL